MSTVSTPSLPSARRSNAPIRGEAGDALSRETRRQIKPMGFSLFLWGNDDAPGRDKYRLMIEGAKYFDRHGFEAVWTPERHFHAFGGPYPNPSVTGAALAAVTERLGIRAGSCVAPLHHSIRIAEEWAVVDNLSNGRAAVAFASGWQLNDFVLRPENHAENKRIMLEQIDQVRRLWRGEKIVFRNPLGKEVLIQALPRPVQRELPFWITTAGSSDTYRMAGELGGNVLTHLLGQTVEQVAEKVAVYRKARAAAGHDPASGRVTLMLHTLVGSYDDEARELVRQPMKDYLRSSLKLVAELAGHFPAFKRAGDSNGNGKAKDVDLRALPQSEIEAMLDVAFERYYETSGLFGTPATCARMVECCRNAGVDEIACLLDFGVPTERVMASLEGLNDLRGRANNQPVSEEADTALSVSSGNRKDFNFTRGDNCRIYSFLAKLRERNIRVSADGGQLRCNAPAGALTAELRDELKQRKGEILEFLHSAGKLARQQRAIVPLQPHGTRAPVFGVAGHNGDVFCYRFLAKHLGGDQAFFGLEPPGLDGQSEPLARIEDLAAYFAGQIREFRPAGPYIIAGFCAGGSTALEVARQLLNDGADVRMVALFGCPFPTMYRPWLQMRQRIKAEARRVLRHTRALATLSFTDLRSYITVRWRSLKAERSAARSAVLDPLMQQRDQLARVTLAALRRHRFTTFPGRVCLFLPTKAWLDWDEAVAPWRRVAPRSEEYYGPDGSTGDTMLREPYAPAFAELFRRCCDPDLPA